MLESAPAGRPAGRGKGEVTPWTSRHFITETLTEINKQARSHSHPRAIQRRPHVFGRNHGERETSGIKPPALRPRCCPPHLCDLQDLIQKWQECPFKPKEFRVASLFNFNQKKKKSPLSCPDLIKFHSSKSKLKKANPQRMRRQMSAMGGLNIKSRKTKGVLFLAPRHQRVSTFIWAD